MSGAKRASDLIELHHVLTAKIEDTGAVTLGLGDVDAEIALDERVVLLQTPGVVSIPPIGAETVSLNTSNGYITIAARDIRTGAIAGNVRMGETTVYAPGSQACTMYKNDGSITHMTTQDGTAEGQTVYDRTSATAFTRFAPWGRETFDKNGYHLFTFSGARLDMGGIGGLPSPLSSLGSWARLSAKMVSIEGSVVALGPRTGVADAVAKSTPLIAALNALSTLLAALEVPGAFVSSPSGGPCTVGPALATAITTAQTALGTAENLIPSNCATVSG